MSIIVNKSDIGKDKENINEYINCFPGHSESTIQYYLNNNKNSEKWVEFNEFGKKYGFCAFEKTTINEILNEYSRYEYKDILLNGLNRIYDKKSNFRNNKCISHLKIPVYWIHSLCVFKNSRGRGKCINNIIPEIIQILRNMHKTEQILLLADVVDKNYASLNCFIKNNFVITELSKNKGVYYNKGLDEYCNMLMLVINPPILKGGKRKKTIKKKTIKKNKKGETLIKNIIDLKTITIFSKSYCPYCNKVKDKLINLNIKHKVIELDKINNGNTIQALLEKITKVRTVPSVWINGKYIGGSEETIKYLDEKY